MEQNCPFGSAKRWLQLTWKMMEELEIKANNQSFSEQKSWFLIFKYLDLLAPAPDVGTLSTHVGTSDEMKSRPEVVDLMATSKHWQIPWSISLHERISMSRNESRCISRLFATKLWLSGLRAFWFLFWETWELSTKKAVSCIQSFKSGRIQRCQDSFEGEKEGSSLKEGMTKMSCQ